MMRGVGQKLGKEEKENVNKKKSVNIIVAVSNVSYAATIWINIVPFLDYMIQKVGSNVEVRSHYRIHMYRNKHRIQSKRDKVQ